MSNNSMKSERFLLESMGKAIKKGDASLSISQEKRTEVALLVVLDKSDDLLSALNDIVVSDAESLFTMDDQGERIALMWQAVTPKSIHHFSSAFGDQIAYLGVAAMHENPGSIHALNTAYCMGRKMMIDNLKEKDKERGLESPAP